MKFKNLNGIEIRIDIIAARFPIRSRAKSKSEGQFNLGRQIQNIYGETATILEEWSIPSERLFIDFYLPHHGLAFEFQGIQHDKFNKHFHIDRQGFERSKQRDARKAEWCVLNDIILIEVRDPAISARELQDIIVEARRE